MDAKHPDSPRLQYVVYLFLIIYLFICGIFNDAVSSSDHTTSYKLERTGLRNEEIVAEFVVLFRNLSGKIEKITENMHAAWTNNLTVFNSITLAG
jgi:hypothetical protein